LTWIGDHAAFFLSAAYNAGMKYQVSRRLGLVLVLLMLLAIVVGVRAGLAHHHQQAAIAEFDRLGGVVSLQNGGPDWLRRIVGNNAMRVFKGVYLVNLSETETKDADLAHLQAMREVERLNLANVPVTDAGLAHLNGLTKLAALDLSGTEVTDSGLIHLGGLTNLQFLYLDGTQVTDAGLRHLDGLRYLRELSVSETGVTEAGIERLEHQLPELDLTR
jgi:hypothetical protein